jgi:hypothetical protein
MRQERADEFDREAKNLLLQSYPSGEIPLQVTGSVVWGYPAPHAAEEA